MIPEALRVVAVSPSVGPELCSDREHGTLCLWCLGLQRLFCVDFGESFNIPVRWGLSPHLAEEAVDPKVRVTSHVVAGW